MTRYLKYLPYFILERKLKNADDFNAPTVKWIHDKKIKMVLIEIEHGVWMGTSKRDYLIRQKERLERELAETNEDLERLNDELS